MTRISKVEVPIPKDRVMEAMYAGRKSGKEEVEREATNRNQESSFSGHGTAATICTLLYWNKSIHWCYWLLSAYSYHISNNLWQSRLVVSLHSCIQRCRPLSNLYGLMVRFGWSRAKHRNRGVWQVGEELRSFEGDGVTRYNVMSVLHIN